jgi:hypothetical protein
VDLIKNNTRRKVTSQYDNSSEKKFRESLSCQNKKTTEKTERQRQTENPEKLLLRTKSKYQKWTIKNRYKII